MKLDKLGIKGYSLQDIGLMVSKDLTLAVFCYSLHKRDLIEFFERDGVYAYDLPFYTVPPLFSYSIMYGHRLFAGNEEYMVNMSLPSASFSYKQFINVQFYATIIPLLADFLVMVVVLIFGCIFFNRLTGVLAGLFICVNPVNIFASQRIWPDTLFTLLIFATVVLCYFALTKNRLWYSILGGFFLGLSLLTKNTAVLTFVPLFLLPFVIKRNFKSGLRSIFSMNFILIFVIAIMVTLPWYSKTIAHYGVPFYHIKQPSAPVISEWFKIQAQRPWYTFLVDTVFQMPLYLLGYYSVIMICWNIRKSQSLVVLLSIWYLTFLILLTVITSTTQMLGPENRYMLPGSPPLALLSAWQLSKSRGWLLRKFKKVDLFILACLVIISIWSIKIAMPPSLNYQQALIAIPY